MNQYAMDKQSGNEWLVLPHSEREIINRLNRLLNKPAAEPTAAGGLPIAYLLHAAPPAAPSAAPVPV